MKLIRFFYFRIFINFLFFLTIPSLVYPLAEVQAITIQTQRQNDSLFSYDNILDFLKELEEGELENKYIPEDLDRINQFIAYLAKEGSLSNEEIILENDIQELMYGEENALFTFDTEDDFCIVPALSYGPMQTLLCKGWVKKKCRRTKKFIKKHKKAIIIGAVVVVAATIVVCAVAAASTASAAAAAGAAASSSGSHKEKSSSTTKDQESIPSSAQSQVQAEAVPPIIAIQAAPHLKAALDEHASFFKEVIAETNLSQSYDNASFGEQARDLGALLVHETLDGVSELAAFIPLLNEEIQEIASKILPDSIFQPNDLCKGTSMESYEGLIAVGHKKIDQFFSTDQAERYTPETKSQDRKNDFVLGILPPVILGGTVNTIELLESGKVLDRAGFTKAGRALMKHGYREGSVFPKPIGNPTQINEHGQKILEMILNHPERKVTIWKHKKFGELIDVEVQGLGGVRFSGNGETMIGFLEP